MRSTIQFLQYPFSLDAPLSMYAPSDEGFSTANTYLLTERDEVLLIDTSLGIHRDDLLADIAPHITNDRALSILPLRMGEMNSIANVYALVDQLPVRMLYGNMGDPASLVTFLPRDAAYGSKPRSGPMAELSSAVVKPGGSITVGSDLSGVDRIELLNAPLQLLPFPWAFDRQTCTLFTSDVMNYRTRTSKEGPWVVTDPSDMMSDDEVYRYLSQTRYWWLPGANTATIRNDIQQIFADREVTTIAPAFGCVLQGASVVEAHVSQLLRLLERAEDDAQTGVEAGLWRNWPNRAVAGHVSEEVGA